MDKILVDLYLPALGRSFDVYIPLFMKLHEVVLILNQAIADLSAGTLPPTAKTVLCDRETGTPLDINSSAMELNLHNGSRLMLI